MKNQPEGTPPQPNLASVEADLFGVLFSFHQKVTALLREASLDCKKLCIVMDRIQTLIDDAADDMKRAKQMNLGHRMEFAFEEVKKLVVEFVAFPVRLHRHEAEKRLKRQAMSDQGPHFRGCSMDSTKVPWLTKEGFNPAKFPIDGILKQAIGDDERQVRSALLMLESMYCHGRKEAGLFLMGLLLTCEDKWELRSDVVRALGVVETQACADLLFQELKRVESSNTTRRYLTQVIKVLAAMPSELVLPGFTALASDKSFSYKMRDKFKAILQQNSMEDDAF